MLNIRGPHVSLNSLEAMVALAVSCVEYTESLEQCQKLPFVLSRALNIDCIAVFIAGTLKPNPLLTSAFGHHVAFSSPEGARDLMVRLNEQILPHTVSQPPGYWQSFHARQLGQHLEKTEPAQYDGHSRVAVVSVNIDAHHRIAIVAHKRFGNLGITVDVFDGLCILTHELSKQLRSTLAWQSPRSLGPPFDSLTEQELHILMELKSELSEKQIAIKLDVGLHTLHSHIKSIYRKVKVQGRLGLISQLNAARRKSRLDAHTPYATA